MNKVVHFEIPYADRSRAEHFYSHIFGWEIADMDMPEMEYSSAVTGPTDDNNMPKEPGFISGALMPKNDMIKSPVIAMSVDDINKTVEMVIEHGGQKLMEPMAVGDMGFYSYVRDTEDNVVGIWQDKKK